MSKSDWIYTLIKKFGLEAEIIDKILSENPELDTDPVNQIIELEDSPEKCFVWDVDMTDEQITEFTRNLQNTFVKKYNRDPSSLHFIRNDINSIRELSPGEVRSRVQPWLNNNGGDQ